MKDVWRSSGQSKAMQYYHSSEELDAAHPELAEFRKERAKEKGYSDPSPEDTAMFKTFNLQPVPPPEMKDFIYVCNPIYCGFKAFEIALDVEQLGMGLTNHHQTVFLVAHLYNAVRQAGLLEEAWPEMDYIIAKQMGLFFAGALPITEQECAKRYALQLGFKTQHFAKNRRGPRTRGKDLMRPGMKNGPQMSSSKTAAIFHPYFCKEKTLEQCLYQLEQLIQDSAESSTKSKSKASVRQQYQRQLTPLQLLTRIQNWLPEAMREMRIDYLSLVRAGNVLLRKIKDEILLKTSVEHSSTKSYLSGEDSNDAGLVLMVLDILNEAADAAEMGEEIYRGKESELRPKGGPQLDIVGRVMEGFVVERNKVEYRRRKVLEGKKEKAMKEEEGRKALEDTKRDTQDVDVSQMSMLERLRLGK